jgi:hypothetical protein
MYCEKQKQKAKSNGAVGCTRIGVHWKLREIQKAT